MGNQSSVYEADGAEKEGSSLAGDDEDSKDDNKMMKNMPKMTGEQAKMFNVLQQKKHMVINGLIGVLSYKNRENLELTAEWLI